MKRHFHVLAPLLALAVFAGAIWLLHRELKDVHLADVVRGLGEIPTSHLLAALALTALNYTCLVGYDWLAVRHVGGTMSLGKIAVTSFIAYVSSYNFGALLGGTSVRYRLYSAFGLSAVDVVKVLALLGLTFWVGFSTLAGVLFLIEPLRLPTDLKIPIHNIRPVGIVLLVSVAVYLGISAVRRRPIVVRGWEFALPPIRLTVQQIVVASVDLLLAASVLYVLLPAEIAISFPMFVGIYLLTAVTVLLSHVPGGLGVFELVMLTLLAPQDPERLLSSLLVFRAIYYFLPLGVAALLMGTIELLLRRETLGRLGGTARIVGQAAETIVPHVAALLTFAAGAVLMFSGALPIRPPEHFWLDRVLALPIVETSHFVGSLAGCLLLWLALGLERRLDTAYVLSVVAALVGMAASLVKGFHYVEALLLAALVAILFVSRGAFYRKGSLFSHRFTPGWTVAIVLVIGSMVWLGMFAHKHVEYRDDLWWTFSLSDDAPRFLRASVGVVALALVISFVKIIRPAAPRPQPPSPEQLEAASRIAACSKRTYANLALLGDKRLLFDDERTALVMFAVSGRSWVSMSDPVGPPEKMTEMVWRFRELCDEYDGWPVFYEVSEAHLTVYLEAGLSLLKIGEEARVPLEAFTLEGAEHRNLRRAHHRLDNQSLSFEVVSTRNVPPLLGEMRRVSDAWLAEKRSREKGFSLGFFHEDYLRRFPAAVLRRDGQIVAFANVLEGAEHEELSIDLMRYRPDAPSGVMEVLFVELMLWGRQQGYRWFNLGMAPLAGLESHRLASAWHRAGALVFQHGDHFYNFEGLRQYKEKFRPVWSSKYLASPGGWALPRILGNVTTLISGGLSGVITK